MKHFLIPVSVYKVDYNRKFEIVIFIRSKYLLQQKMPDPESTTWHGLKSENYWRSLLNDYCSNP